MKKILFIFVVLTFVVTGCGAEEAKKEPEKALPAPTAQDNSAKSDVKIAKQAPIGIDGMILTEGAGGLKTITLEKVNEKNLKKDSTEKNVFYTPGGMKLIKDPFSGFYHNDEGVFVQINTAVMKGKGL